MAGRLLALSLSCAAPLAAVVLGHRGQRGGARAAPPSGEPPGSPRSAPGAYRQELRNYKDSQYYGQVKVGSQVLEGVLDTGSTELVVFSDRCGHRCGPDIQKLYHAATSSGYQDGPLALDISYGSGELNGREAYDNVSIGPFSANEVPFWEVLTAKMPILAVSEFEAIVGLGPIPPNVDVMAPRSPANKEAYALVLRKLGLTRYSVCLSATPGAPGYLTWKDASHTTSPGLFTQLDVVGTQYWMAKLTDVTLGQKSFTLCRRGCGAVIDSGTSLLAMPKRAFRKLSPLMERLGGQAGCDVGSLPDIRFKLDGKPYSMPPDSYMGAFHGDVPSALSQHFERKAGAPCQPAIMSLDLRSSVGDVWVLGVPFLRNFLTVFEQGDRPKMYTARASNDCYAAAGDKLALHGGRRTTRHFNASDLRLPRWLRRTRQAGPLELDRDPRGQPAGAARR